MATKTEHWAADEAARDRLLDFGHQHGLDGKGIVDVLGVEKLSDYANTEAEAIATLALWAQAQQPPDEPPVPAYQPPELDQEAVTDYANAIKGLASAPVWIRLDERGHFEVSVQAWLPPALTRVGLTYARQALEDYRGIFGDVLVTNGNAQGNSQPALQLVQKGSNGTHQTQTFSPQFMEYAGKSTKGSLYWKCKGHPFNQFGVTIWEEALPSELKDRALADLTQDLDLTGWVATYTLQPSKDDPDKLVPDKVVSLTKAA